jgi:GNAT superfamily N-acetyltransferase
MSQYHYKIMRSRDDEEKFFGKLGKYFASKAVRDEMGGYPMNDSPAHTWLVAIDKRTFHAIGFVSLEEKKDHWVLHDFYVQEAHRGKGVMKTLLQKSLHFAGDRKVSGKVPRSCSALFEKRGFAVADSHTNWVTITKE